MPGTDRAADVQAAPGHLRAVPAVVPPPGLVGGARVIVGPADLVPGQHVEDGPGGRVVEQVVGRVVDQAVGRPGDEEPAVGERRPQARAEPAVGDAGTCGPARSRTAGRPRTSSPWPRPARPRRGRDRRSPAAAASLPATVCAPAANPSHRPSAHCWWAACQLCDGTRGRWPVEGWCRARTGAPSGPRVGHVGLAVGPERETLAAARQHAEVVVVGVVLHHQDHDVLDLRQQVRARRAGLRARAGLGLPPPGQALEFMTLDVMPHACCLRVGGGSAPRACTPRSRPYQPAAIRRAFTAMTRFVDPRPGGP